MIVTLHHRIRGRIAIALFEAWIGGGDDDFEQQHLRRALAARTEGDAAVLTSVVDLDGVTRELEVDAATVGCAAARDEVKRVVAGAGAARGLLHERGRATFRGKRTAGSRFERRPIAVATLVDLDSIVRVLAIV